MVIARHDPTPWVCRRMEKFGEVHYWITYGKHDFALGLLPNAPFIVQAVNAYEPMLAALRAAFTIAEEGTGLWKQLRDAILLAEEGEVL